MARPHIRTFLAAALWLAALTLPAACAGEAAPCSGDGCRCPEQSYCRLSCEGSGCAFFCPASSRCGFVCEAGGCTAQCVGSPSCDMACHGGGCSMRCIDGADCEIYECPSCPLECDPYSLCKHEID